MNYQDNLIRFSKIMISLLNPNNMKDLIGKKFNTYVNWREIVINQQPLGKNPTTTNHNPILLQVQETRTSHPPEYASLSQITTQFVHDSVPPLVLNLRSHFKFSTSQVSEMVNLGTWIMVLRLCALFLFLEAKVFVLGVDDSNVQGGNSIDGSGGVSELCVNDLASFMPPPYGNSSDIVCKPIWNTFVLRYTQTDDHVMNIMLSAVYTTGWVGIGFSRDGLMVGSSAIVGWVNRKGQARIKQYFLQGSKSSQVIPDKGELPLTGIPATVVLHGPRIYLAFQLKFQAQLARQPLILAVGSGYPKHNNHLPVHTDKTTIKFDFSAGSASEAPTDFKQMKKNHGILAIFGWGLILPLGAIVPRYFKHKDPLWYYLHSIIQFVGFVIGLAAVVLGQQLYTKIDANFQTHRGIGIFVLVLSILQILAFFLRPSKDAKIRRYWNWYHHWFGRLAVFFAAVNIVLGIKIGAPGIEWKISYGFFLSIILLAVIVLEALARMRRTETKDTMPPNFQMNPVP